ncbi:unnamed protein product [Euphydryas editha]|uniref:Endonuclease/exonuclease/phosphatase domain-containing protein n=1 Tax=Euphydryas editha TaxID=104508 RepID=A0AAU9VF38_EUPED|nr:unnamed protein product [Euphydryas editha]
MAINIYYQNVRGLRTKTEDVLKNILINNYNVIVFTETWLNSNVTNLEFIDKRYTVYRRDRLCSETTKKDGGGVLVAVSKHISSSRHSNWESDAEDIWVSIDIKTNNIVTKILICVVYLPPPMNLESLTRFLEHTNDILDKADQVIILGDFNMGFIGWSRGVDGVSCSAFNYGSPQGLALTDFMALNNITQMNSVPNEDGRVLDLVLTNCVTLEVSNSLNTISKIDRKHPPLLITVSELIPHFLKPAQKPRHNFFKANYDLIIAHLREINWSQQFDKCQNVDEMTTVFYRILNNAVETYVPISRPKKSRFPSWFSKSLIRVILEKESQRKKFVKYKNPRDRLEYELLRERSKKIIDACLQNYKKRVEGNIIRNPKYFWNYIKDRRGGETTIPAEMSLDDQIANTGTKIAELFAKNFASVFSNTVLPDSLESTVHGLPYLSLIKFSEHEIK